MSYNIHTSQQQTRDEIGVEDNIRFIPKRFSENARLTMQATKIQETDINNSFILGHPVNGVMGVTSPQILLGDYRTTGTLQRVFSPNNTFVEKFRNEEFIDTSVSSGTLTSDYPGSYTQTDGAFQTLEVFKDASGTQTVQSATVTIDGTLVTSGDIQLSADGGANY